MVISLLKRWRHPRYDTLNRIEVLGNSLEYNFRYLQSLQPDALIIPVLKSNAYGHGLAAVSSVLGKIGVKMAAVDSFPEAQIVARHFRGRILILGEMPEQAYRYARSRRLEFCVYNSATLAAIAAFQPGASVHLFANTGMNREGIQDMAAFLESNRSILSKLRIRGLCSHLSSGEEADGVRNRQQAEKFFHDLDVMQRQGFFPDTVQLGNSAGIFSLSDPRLNAFRTGLAFYGYNPFPVGHPQVERAATLKPALRLISKIVSLQKLEAGDPVSYNGDFVSASAGQSAVIPFGYYEGLDRRLSGRVRLLLRGSREAVPIAGRICMNLCCLDVTGKQVSLGDEVEIISVNPEAENSIINLSNISKNIPYETLTGLRDNIRREVIWQ